MPQKIGKRELEIRIYVKDALIGALEEALTGSEAVFKEVWEECDNDDLKVADDEIARLLKLIKGHKP